MLAVAPTTCSADVKYAFVSTFDGSCGTLRVSELRKVQSTSGARYANTGSGCALQTAAGPGQQSTVSLGDVVAWTDFVEATESIGAGVMRCAPEDRPGAALYGDSDCTQAVMVDDYRGQNGCSALETFNANLWVEPTADLCSGLRAVYTLNDDRGVQTLESDLYSWQNDYSAPSSSKPALTCRSSGSRGNGGYGSQSRRTIAANITSSLASVPRVGGGSARLVPTFVWPPGPSSALVPGWHDTERDVDCSFALASDGKTRCLPVPAETACIGAARFVRTVSSTCPATTTVYALGAAPVDLPGASIINGPDRCAKVGGVTAAREATVVDPGQFVEGASSVE